jgi:hypothetical protein
MIWNKLNIAQKRRILAAVRLPETLSLADWEYLTQSEQRLISRYEHALLYPQADSQAAI